MFSELCRETLRKAAVCYNSSGRSSASPSPPSSPPPSPSKSIYESASTGTTTSLSTSSSSSSSSPSSSRYRCNNETRDVGCNSRNYTTTTTTSTTTNEQHHSYHMESGYLIRRSTSPPEFRESRKRAKNRKTRRKRSTGGSSSATTAATPTNISSRRTSGLDTRDGRRQPYAATVDYSSTRDQQYQQYQSYQKQNYNKNKNNNNKKRGRSASPEILRKMDEIKDTTDSSSEPDDNSSNSGDEAGTASDENSQRPSSAHNRHSLTKGLRRRSYQFDEDSLDGDHPYEHEGRESSGSHAATNKDLDRARLVRERQNEERQRKLEEIRQQALAAQRFREQREEERRRRIEELRSRDNDRRSQVEERKRQIWEAERERREAIIRKNQEREARIEAKRKNERSHIVFAFGSSTPRMLEPADTGGMTASFWGTRRATSTSNVMMFSSAVQPLTRRSSERELDAGSKKRATSAGGLDRKPGEDMRMSSSMYEVFNWNDTPDPPLTPAKSKRASLSFPPTTDIFSIDDMSMIDDVRRPMTHRGAFGDDNDGTIIGGPTTPTSSSNSAVLAAAAAGCVTRYANRRRTDLMPTIPSPRDSSSGSPINPLTGSISGRSSSSAKSFTRSPGRTYSMSRLDQLAQPRRRPQSIINVDTTTTTTISSSSSNSSALQHQQKRQNLTASSMSRSMSHLAGTAASASAHAHASRLQAHHGVLGPLLKRTDNSRSMGTLPGSGLGNLLMINQPRPTRAERLRRKAREHQQAQQQNSGIRSGEATPSSPSRPHSSLSQQSGASSVASVASGAGGNVILRPRTSGTPRRPRPASIAGTGVSSVSVDRNNATGETRGQKDAKPPLPKVHSSTPKRPLSAGIGQSCSMVKSMGSRSGRPSPRATPKATPLQSPGVEQPQPPHLELIKELSKPQPMQLKLNESDEERKVEVKTEIKPEIAEKSQPVNESKVTETINESVQKSQTEPTPEPSVPSAPVAITEVVAAAASVPNNSQIESVEDQSTDKIDESIRAEKKSPEPETKADSEIEEVCDMTASMIQKIRITTEEEAKAALAERRRLAREQAEREAELEKQRLEEEARLEAERLRAEEEEQRRLEEETLRLANEAREAEEQRLKQAIEEAERREEEDRRRREEEARQKAEKEEAERKARIEAEKQRLEMVERLKKEEEERNARRKRVEAIMSRTRKSQANAQKGEGNDGEKSKEDSPSDESKPAPGDKSTSQDLMTASLIAEATQQLISSEQMAHHAESNNSTSPTSESPNNGLVQRNGTTGHSNGIALLDNNSSSNNKSLLDNDNPSQQELNGHHNNSTSHGNGIDGQTIALDNATVKQNNVTNNLLDLSDFESLSNSNNSSPLLLMQSDEDSINSNLNPTAVPFTPNFGLASTVNANPFQDTFPSNKQQQDNQVTDLLL